MYFLIIYFGEQVFLEWWRAKSKLLSIFQFLEFMYGSLILINIIVLVVWVPLCHSPKLKWPQGTAIFSWGHIFRSFTGSKLGHVCRLYKGGRETVKTFYIENSPDKFSNRNGAGIISSVATLFLSFSFIHHDTELYTLALILSSQKEDFKKPPYSDARNFLPYPSQRS